MKKLFIFAIFLTAVLAFNTFGQSGNSGKLNVWTTANISRLNEKSGKPASLKEVRVGKNKGFDRVVFEFTGDLPNFTVEYVKPPITATGEEQVKISGKYFVEITFHSLLFPEDENYKYEKIIKANLNLPVVSALREIEWFEGVRPFAVGLKAKKGFRVSQFTNPARLIVDFKQ
ncbi:MAG TPA: hypothetical protein VNB22_17300 [Pyrinomonadaceae bacterium]|nr:hypothetical protein [Pyrinomonadaceae bacterium]